MRQMIRVSRYRFRTTFARRWGGYLAIALLVALVGGIAMGAIAGARRTQSSFPAYLAHTDAADLSLGTALYDPQIKGFDTAYDAGTIATIRALPHVRQVADFTGVDPSLVPLGPFKLHQQAGQAPPEVGGSRDGDWSAIDRVAVASGRLADPRRVDEMVMSAAAERELGMHIGSVLPMGFCSDAHLLAGGCSATGKGEPGPAVKVNLKLVGIVTFDSSLVEDDVDALQNDNAVLLTPALMQELVKCCSFYTFTSIRVEGGSRNVAAVVSEITTAVPKLKANASFTSPTLTSSVVTTAERAIEPESVALGTFGVIAAIAALLIAAQLIGRQLRAAASEQAVLRALGAGPATTAADGLFGVVGAIATGAVLAGAVAFALSPLAPLGPVRRVYHQGFALDWTVIGIGVGGLIVLLSAIAAAIAFRQAAHRVARRRQVARARGSRSARAAASAGLPTPAVTGIRFALDPGAGTNAVPVRSAIIGAVLAIVVVTSTLTFGTSLRTLVSRPALYGWNWDYQLLSGFSGQENLPEKQVAQLLAHDPYVRSWTGVYFGDAELDGHAVPFIGTSPRPAVAPPLLTGHGFDAPDQVVLGASTLAQLHKHVGDTVEVKTSDAKPVTLRIVGTATMPAIGTSSLHTTMGIGALFDFRLVPPAARNVQGSPVPGPQAVLIRLREPASEPAALDSLRRINDTINTPKGGGGDEAGGVTGVLRPAEIVNYRSMGSTPALLGAALAAGAIAALTLTLVASVRRRRRELALLKTLGFTRRQLAAVVAWQSTIAVFIGVVVGVPLGLVTGRVLWDVFARQIHVVPRPTVPALTIALVAAGAVVLANVVAGIPGRQAARTRTAVLLRAE